MARYTKPGSRKSYTTGAEKVIPLAKIHNIYFLLATLPADVRVFLRIHAAMVLR